MQKLAIHFLNKYLSPYVKNIDESKLKLQLTSGSVALENLEVVENVLDELDLPICVVSGQLRKFHLIFLYFVSNFDNYFFVCFLSN